mgnify:CR=1 FL=1
MKHLCQNCFKNCQYLNDFIKICSFYPFLQIFIRKFPLWCCFICYWYNSLKRLSLKSKYVSWASSPHFNYHFCSYFGRKAYLNIHYCIGLEKILRTRVLIWWHKTQMLFLHDLLYSFFLCLNFARLIDRIDWNS